MMMNPDKFPNTLVTYAYGPPADGKTVASSTKHKHTPMFTHPAKIHSMIVNPMDPAADKMTLGEMNIEMCPVTATRTATQ